MRADIAQLEHDFEPIQFVIPNRNIARYQHIALPAHNRPHARIHREPGFQLRGYRPPEKNEKLVSSKPTISDEAIVSFLNTNNIIYCQIEIYSDKNMPTQEFRIFPSNITDFDILGSVISDIKSNNIGQVDLPDRTITEIHVTPVYQNIKGFPKIFTDDDKTISVLTALRKSAHIGEITLDDI